MSPCDESFFFPIYRFNGLPFGRRSDLQRMHRKGTTGKIKIYIGIGESRKRFHRRRSALRDRRLLGGVHEGGTI
jgi:hypothetical protein